MEEGELDSGGGKDRGEKKMGLGLRAFYMRGNKIWIVEQQSNGVKLLLFEN